MLKRFKYSLCLLMRLVLLAGSGAIFFCLFGRYNNRFLLILNRTSAITALAFLLVYMLISRVYGGFDIGTRKSKPIILSMMLNTLAADLAAHLFMCIMDYSVIQGGHFVYERPLLLLCVFACQSIWIVAMTYLGNGLYFCINPPQNCLLICKHGFDAKTYEKHIGHYKKQYHICDMAEPDDPELLNRIDRADAVFFCELTETERSPLVTYCYQHRKDIYYSVEMTDIVAMGGNRVLFGDKTMICSCSKGLTFEERIIKRISDILIALIGLVLTSPVLLLTALAIKLEDGGPVFYCQPRATYAGRVFRVIKFRSMRVEDGTIHKSVTQNDDRITKVGHFIRKFRIDELPQLINVLKSDMSIVGPRPEMMENVEKYTADLPEFAYRLRAKAGLTGMAQIYGKYNTSPKDKLVMDLTYIEKYSIWLDLKLILRTILVLLTPDESTEAFANDEEE